MSNRDMSGIDDSLDRVLSQSLGLPDGETDERRISLDKLTRAAVRVAIRQELTQRQRDCLIMYFMEQLTMEEIGQRLGGIGKSTVYKHIETAKASIRRVIAYAQAFREAMAEEDD